MVSRQPTGDDSFATLCTLCTLYKKVDQHLPDQPGRGSLLSPEGLRAVTIAVEVNLSP